MLAFVLAAPAFAAPSPLASYARARLADAAGNDDEAAAAYEAALVGGAYDASLAMRAYRGAIASGNKRLALRTAQLHDANNVAPPDAVLLLFTDALGKGDWTSAVSFLDRMEREGSLAFLVPVLRGWTDFASGAPDPMAALARRPYDGLAAVYTREHRVLLLLALKRNAEALTALKAETATDGRTAGLKLAAAARLAALKDKAGALLLLPGDDQATVAARALVEAGKPLPGAIDSAPKAVAALFARVALDLMRDRASPTALTFARFASFAAPPSDSVRIALAQSLALSDNPGAALAELDQIPPSSIYAAVAGDTRIVALQSAGRTVEALALAKSAAETRGSANDFGRLGDLLTRTERHAEAAIAYDAAIKKFASGGGPVPWNLWLLYGGALEASGDWSKAKLALAKAVELGPEQAEALNHFGYAMLDRGEDLPEATRLIAKASALRPDDPAITDSLGWAWFKRGDMEQSIRILETAMAGDPTISEIAEHLGDVYWTAGRRVDARYTWRAALVQAPAPKDAERLKLKIADGLAPPRK